MQFQYTLSDLLLFEKRTQIIATPKATQKEDDQNGRRNFCHENGIPNAIDAKQQRQHNNRAAFKNNGVAERNYGANSTITQSGKS